MRIQIRYFAALREVTARDAEPLDLPDGADAAAVRSLVAERYPRLRPVLDRCAVAVNRSYVPAETSLREGDELVFIPPLGGG
jgi:molybdopterin synthase sulfur carrier subunit